MKTIAWIALAFAVAVIAQRAIEQRTMDHFDRILEQMAEALAATNYVAAREFCTRDFELWPPGMGAGATDSNLAFVAAMIIDRGSPRDRSMGKLWSGQNGDYFYMLQTYGHWPFNAGRFYTFRQENDEWKFTGRIDHFVD